MSKRVVITGLGVISPIGNDIESFKLSMQKGISGIKYIKELADYNFASQIGGVPDTVTGMHGHLMVFIPVVCEIPSVS